MSVETVEQPHGAVDAVVVPPPKAVDIFLCYRSTDQAVVAQVESALRTRGLSTFFDRRTLRPGLPWFTAIAEALKTARAIAVFLGPGELGRIQRLEMELALAEQSRRPNRALAVIPVLIDGVQSEDPPGFLMLNTLIDLRGSLFAAGVDRLYDLCRDGNPPAITSGKLQPFRGLEAFSELDHPFFFGREVYVDRLTELIDKKRLIAVVGASGSGKSSVVAAGLVPRVRRRVPPEPTWECLAFKPGKVPTEALSAAIVGLLYGESDFIERQKKVRDLEQLLAPPGGLMTSALIDEIGMDRLLLVVDQFEELFTLVTGDAQRLAFINLLLGALDDPRVTVLLTLRADFFGHATSIDRRLSDLIGEGILALGPMTPEELRRAIELPASGVKFEAGLVDQIIAHAGSEPGGLPLLQFALRQLWNQQRDGVITWNAYDRLGEPARDGVAERPGLLGAVGTYAEACYAVLPPTQQQALMRVFSRLVHVAPANEQRPDTRQRVSWASLTPEEREAAEVFVKNRLLVKSFSHLGGGGGAEEILDVAHEAIIRYWTRLRTYLDVERRKFLQWRQRLDERMRDWEAAKRDRGALLAGRLLGEAREWSRRNGPELSISEREYIRLSDRSRLISLAIVASVLVVGTAIATGWYFFSQPMLRAAGSGTVKDALLAPLRIALANCADVQLDVYDNGSDAALAEVHNHALGLMSDQPDPKRVSGDYGLAGELVISVLVAYDEIAFIVPRSNPVRALPLAPLTDMLFGRTEEALSTRWSTLGLSGTEQADHVVVLWVPRRASGTGHYLEAVLGHGREFVDLKRTEIGPTSHVELVARNPDALGIVSRSVAGRNPGVRTVPIEGDVPPLRRGLFVLARVERDGRIPKDTCRVMRCLLSTPIQSQLAGIHVLPPADEVVGEQLREFGLADGSCRVRSTAGDEQQRRDPARGTQRGRAASLTQTFPLDAR
jgi:ABC-type phosphate transport system substrate-binding protein